MPTCSRAAAHGSCFPAAAAHCWAAWASHCSSSARTTSSGRSRHTARWDGGYRSGEELVWGRRQEGKGQCPSRWRDGMQGHKDPTATRSEGSPACLSPLLSRGWQPHSSPAVPLPFLPAPLAQLLGLGCLALCALGFASSCPPSLPEASLGLPLPSLPPPFPLHSSWAWAASLSVHLAGPPAPASPPPGGRPCGAPQRRPAAAAGQQRGRQRGTGYRCVPRC